MNKAEKVFDAMATHRVAVDIQTDKGILRTWATMTNQPATDTVYLSDCSVRFCESTVVYGNQVQIELGSYVGSHVLSFAGKFPLTLQAGDSLTLEPFWLTVAR